MFDIFGRLWGLRDQGTTPATWIETATPEDIVACFRLLLGRYPTDEEWPGHSSRAGENLAVVVRSFLQSKEFFDRRLLSPGEFRKYELVQVGQLQVAASPDDIDVGKQILSGSYEPHVTAVIKRELKPGMHVVDVGANCGYFSMLALTYVGDQGRVWAIEPNFSNVRLLEVARRCNKSENLFIIPAAAGDAFGPVKLNAAYSNGTISKLTNSMDEVFTAVLACQIPLDCIFENESHVDFVKIDVEGAEYLALKGFERTLDRCHPTIVSEFAPNMMPGISGVSGADYLQFLFQKNYQVGVIQKDGNVSAYSRSTAHITAAHIASGVDHIDILARPVSTIA